MAIAALFLLLLTLGNYTTKGIKNYLIKLISNSNYMPHDRTRLATDLPETFSMNVDRFVCFVASVKSS